MSIFKFSMQAVSGGSSIKQHRFGAPWREFVTTDISEPRKSTHVVNLVYNGKKDNPLVNGIEFENTILKFETDEPNQQLYVDISIFNEALFSKIFKFKGISCEEGHEDMIKDSQCIGANDKRTDLTLNAKYEIDTPMYVVTTFKMPQHKEVFSFFLLIDDLLDNTKDLIYMIDPGVGNGPPKPKI